MTKLFRLILMLVCLAGVLPASAAFKDIKLDLTNKAFLTEDEATGSAAFSFGVAIADDGTPTRVAADDAAAAIVLNGKFHSNEHGWGNFSATVAVEGPVKVSMGSCAWGGDVTVKNAAGDVVGTFNTNNGACYHNDKENNIVSCYYKSTEATTLTVSGGNYTPYIAIEAVDPTEVPNDIKITYQLGDVQAEGTVPAEETVEIDGKYTIPVNNTLYAEGKTLTGWTDGTNTYKPGEEITAGEKDLTLTAVFTDNAVTLADRTEAVTLFYDFCRNTGAPIYNYEGRDGFLVTRTAIGENTIDVKVPFTTSPGKLNNTSNTSWTQCNQGTTFTVPSCKGAVVSMKAYSAFGADGKTATTIDGQSDYASNTTVSYTIASSAETVDIVIGNDAGYLSYLRIVLPVVEQAGGKTYTDEPASVIWDFNNTTNYSTVSSVTPAGGFSLTSVNIGDIEVTGAAGGTAEGVTFVKLKPSGSTTTVEWNVKPAVGLTFTPTRISAYIQRFGTDAQSGVKITAKLADGTEELLGTYTAPRSGKTQDQDKYGSSADYNDHPVIELTEEQQQKLTSADGFSIFATVGVGSTKEGGFSDVRIEGLLNGTIAEIAKYTLTAKTNPEEGGSVTVYPKADEYDEGSEVQLTATPNFGYHFVNWTDAEGNEVSDQAKFTYTLNANAELTANFTAVTTYELNYGVDGGANLYMVSVTPQPTVVDGKNMYEEGTVVTLTASSNKILTFTNWSNGETFPETKLTMDGDKQLTATYSAVDYIVGWDFYNPGNNGRPADFASTTDNESVTLILRDEEGNTEGWLDKSTVAAGGYESLAGAAVNWKKPGRYYYQTSKIDASNFENIKVQANMLFNYNAYTTQVLEYSLDNENWTEVTRITMNGPKVVNAIEGALPAEADHQASLYLRWRPDLTSELKGTKAEDNDGTAIADIYILADALIIDDGTAPMLVSSVPVNGATGASASGKIVLNFDEKVKLTENAKATLGDTELELKVSGMTVTAAYKNLEYATEYVFNLAAGSISDLTDNVMTDGVTIAFTTMVRPEVTKGLYDIEVSTAEEFLSALEKANLREDKDTRYRIFLYNGTYDLGNATLTPISANNISLIGESEEGVIIMNHPEAEGIGTTATLFNSSSNLYLQDITLKNAYDYTGTTGRAVCLQDKGDKTIAKYVKLLSYQDTYYSNKNTSRFYWEDSEIHGTVDFLCGGGDVYYNRVNLVVENRSGNVIAAPNGQLKYGYVFLDCEINCSDEEGAYNMVNGLYYLGRPWGADARAQYINTRMNVLPTAGGWTEMGGNKPLVFAEYNSTDRNGNAVDLSSRKLTFDGGTQVSAELTEAQVEELSIANVMGGSDDWDPTAYTEQAPVPANVALNGTDLTWDDSKYVLLWAVCKDGKVVGFTTEPAYTVDDATATWSVRAANEMGGLGEEATINGVPDSINTIGTTGDNVVKTEFYNLQGIKVSKSFKGTVIKVETLDNGIKNVTKLNK